MADKIQYVNPSGLAKFKENFDKKIDFFDSELNSLAFGNDDFPEEWEVAPLETVDSSEVATTIINVISYGGAPISLPKGSIIKIHNYGSEKIERIVAQDYFSEEGESSIIVTEATTYMQRMYIDYKIHSTPSYNEKSNSLSHGLGCITSGKHSHAEGYNTKASGNASHAEGYKTQSTGADSHAEGHDTQSTGHYSHAEGKGTRSTKFASHAEGIDTNAIGDYSHSEGRYTKASGQNSHAEGYKTQSTGAGSHAEGSDTNAIGDYSHSEGCGTRAANYASAAQGKYNAGMTTGGSSSNTTGIAFVIGNGTSTTALSNAFSVQFDGTVKAKSTITASTTADYAEFFEWLDKNPNEEDRVGHFVTLDGDKIKIATDEDDYILGIVSGEPFVLGNGDCDTWNGMYLHDEFRRTMYEPAPKIIEILDNEGNPTGEYKEVEGEYEGTRPILNPDYDPTQEYISRFDRVEWSPIGMLGVLAVLHDGTAEVNGYVTVNNKGIATKCTRDTRNSYRVIKKVSDKVVEVIFR